MSFNISPTVKGLDMTTQVVEQDTNFSTMQNHKLNGYGSISIQLHNSSNYKSMQFDILDQEIMKGKYAIAKQLAARTIVPVPHTPVVVPTAQQKPQIAISVPKGACILKRSAKSFNVNSDEPETTTPKPKSTGSLKLTRSGSGLRNLQDYLKPRSS